MNKDCYVVGIATGMLLCSLLMLLFPKETTCEVVMGNNRESHVFVGVKL